MFREARGPKKPRTGDQQHHSDRRPLRHRRRRCLDGARRRPQERARMAQTAAPLPVVWPPGRRTHLRLSRLLARPRLLQQLCRDLPRGVAEPAILLVVLRKAVQEDDRVSLGRSVPETEDGQPPDRVVRIAVDQAVEQRPHGVHDSRAVAREELERDESRSPARRALVFQPAPQELGLLAEAELPDRTVGNGPLAEVAAPRRTLELVVPALP
jgi:hypothetical protein